LKVTIAKWLTPKGVSISEKGIEPDIKVPFTEDDAKNKKDPQMDKAVEFLNK
jgi:carboxyl-terminal processing protease